MREPFEIVTASLLQNIVQIRKKKHYVVTNIVLRFGQVLLGHSALRAPKGEIYIYICLYIYTTNKKYKSIKYIMYRK